MKKFQRIFLLLLVLVFLTTYSPKQFKFHSEKENLLFKIENVIITNNKLVKEDEINKKLNHIYNKNILFIKKQDLENPLKSINFLERIEVKKKYPKTIIIKVFETKPIGILIKKNNKYLLDSSSNLINFDEISYSNTLPHIFGEDAEYEFVNFILQLKENNFPIKKVSNYYFFRIGRWNLQLVDKQIIKFPANKTDEAIKKSIELLNRDDFKNYSVIDLRINGKIVVE